MIFNSSWVILQQDVKSSTQLMNDVRETIWFWVLRCTLYPSAHTDKHTRPTMEGLCRCRCPCGYLRVCLEVNSSSKTIKYPWGHISYLPWKSDFLFCHLIFGSPTQAESNTRDTFPSPGLFFLMQTPQDDFSSVVFIHMDLSFPFYYGLEHLDSA